METDDPGIITQVHRLVHAIGLLVDRASDGQLDQPGALVLWHLRSDGSATMTDLHRAFGHRRSTLTNVVDRLEKQKFVQRKGDSSDRRSYVISLTAKGRKISKSVVDAFAALEADAASASGGIARQAARDMLARLVDATQRYGERVTKPSSS